MATTANSIIAPSTRETRAAEGPALTRRESYGIAALSIAHMPVPPRAKRAASKDPDATLLALSAELARAAEQEEAACRVKGRATTDEAKDAADIEIAAAFAEWEAIVERIAEIPANGLVGIAVKAAQICRAADLNGGTEADERLGHSLRADIARLAPGVSVA